MKRLFSVLGMLVLFGGLVSGVGNSEVSEETALKEIMALELGTYETYYGKSDPTTYLELFADKATIFDAWTLDRFDDGAINDYLMAFKGQIPILDYEILNPRVDLYGETAVFVFNVNCTNPKDGSVVIAWKGTAVFRRTRDSWERVHAHFSTAVAPPPA